MAWRGGPGIWRIQIAKEHISTLFWMIRTLNIIFSMDQNSALASMIDSLSDLGWFTLWDKYHMGVIVNSVPIMIWSPLL